MSKHRELSPKNPERMHFATKLGKTTIKLLQELSQTTELNELPLDQDIRNAHIIYDHSQPTNSKTSARCSILGSDAIKLVSLNTAQVYDHRLRYSCALNVRLYRDGSPYVPFYDFDKSTINEYVILANPRTPPAAINKGIITQMGITATNLDQIEQTIIVASHNLKDSVHPLSDKECNAILSVVDNSQSQIDVTKTLSITS